MQKAGYEVGDYADSYMLTSEITPSEQQCKFAFKQGMKKGFIAGLLIGCVVGFGFFVGIFRI